SRLAHTPLFLYCPRYLRHLHSFPTRRSSDLVVKNSVKAHTFADKGIKVGSFLSAGVDSSLVTALMRPDNTFSIGFDSTYDETKQDRKSTRLNSSHVSISYAVFCLKTKKTSRF